MSDRCRDRDEGSDPTAKGISRTTKWLQPSAKVTPQQAFYVFGIHGIGAMIVAGIVNFAIACGKSRFHVYERVLLLFIN